jgi:hypothetical protein
LPVLPTHKCCSVNNLGWHPQHGMEEVIGSIPIRSTNYSNTLAISAKLHPFLPTQVPTQVC